MTKVKNINSSSITEQCYNYMVDNNITRLNVYDFIDHIKEQMNISEEEFVSQMSYFYTDLNLDGRFVCVEDGSWMLKDNLSVEDVMNFVEPSIHKFELDDEDELSLLEEDEDIVDEVDELLDEEDGEEEDNDLYEFDDEIVSKYQINTDDDEF